MENARTKPVPVRMDGALRKRIRKAARSIGLTDSAVMRLGVLIVLPQIEAGQITVPPKSNAA